MASRNVSAQGSRAKLQPHAASAVQFIEERELDLSTAGLLAEKVLALDDASPFRFIQPALLDSDNYQVVLIPSAKRAQLQSVDTLSPAVPPVLLLPLTWKELALRIGAEAGQANLMSQNNVVRFGFVRVDLFSMEVSRSEQRVALTALEFKVLRFLMLHPGRVLSRDQLLREVWRYNNYPSTRTVDNHLWRLRQKLESDPAHPVHFRTVHGVGYKFVPQTSAVIPEQKG